MSLHAIAYVSTSKERIISANAIDRLLSDAREFNQSCGVTGVLLHHDGNFFQYYEGPSAGVKLVHKRINESTSHFNIVEMLNIEVNQRHFSTWAMGFAEATQTELQRISQATWSDELQKIVNQPTSSLGLVLLLGFWERTAPAAGLLPNNSRIQI